MSLPIVNQCVNLRSKGAKYIRLFAPRDFGRVKRRAPAINAKFNDERDHPILHLKFHLKGSKRVVSGQWAGVERVVKEMA
jgi:hypothetical protein